VIGRTFAPVRSRAPEPRRRVVLVPEGERRANANERRVLPLLPQCGAELRARRMAPEKVRNAAAYDRRVAQDQSQVELHTTLVSADPLPAVTCARRRRTTLAAGDPVVGV